MPPLLGARSNRLEPALSGNGRYLVSVLENQGKARVLLQEQPSGRVVPLRHLRGREPHSSPSLSWKGRYLAVVVQQGPQRVAVVEDRLSGRLIHLPLRGRVSPLRLSMAPDASQVAVQVVRGGQWQVELLDLSRLMEPDRAAGSAVVGGGAAADSSPLGR